MGKERDAEAGQSSANQPLSWSAWLGQAAKMAGIVVSGIVVYATFRGAFTSEDAPSSSPSRALQSFSGDPNDRRAMTSVPSLPDQHAPVGSDFEFEFNPYGTLGASPDTAVVCSAEGLPVWASMGFTPHVIALPGPAGKGDVQGELGVITSFSELHVINVTDASELSALTIPGQPAVVKISGTRAYVGGTAGVTVVDITNPRFPEVIDTVSTRSNVQGLVPIGDGLVYTAEPMGVTRLNVTSGVSLSYYNSTGGVFDVTLSSSRLFAAEGTFGVRELNPDTLAVIDTVNTVGTASDLATDGERIFVADRAGGVVELGAAIEPISTSDAQSVAVDGSRLVIADGTGGVLVFSNTTNPIFWRSAGAHDVSSVSAEGDVILAGSDSNALVLKSREWTIWGTPGAGNVGTETIVITCTGDGTAQLTFRIVSQGQPVFQPMDTAYFQIGSFNEIQVVATDPNPEDTVTFSFDTVPSGQWPGWLSRNSAGQLSGTPTGEGKVRVKVTATDGKTAPVYSEFDVVPTDFPRWINPLPNLLAVGDVALSIDALGNTGESASVAHVETTMGPVHINVTRAPDWMQSQAFSKPILRDQYNPPGSHVYAPYLEKHRGRLYVPGHSGGLVIVNANDPDDLQYVGEFVPIEYPSTTVDVAPIDDNTVFMVDSQGRLYVVDVSTPSLPQQMSMTSLTPTTPKQVAYDANGKFAIVGRETNFLWPEILVYNTTNPEALVQIGNYNTDNRNSYEGIHYDAGSRRLYFADYRDLYIVNASDPTKFSLLDSVSLNLPTEVHGFAVCDSFAYLGVLDSTFYKIKVIDLTLGNMHEVSTYEMNFKPTYLSCGPNVLFATNYNAANPGVALDTTDPSNLVLYWEGAFDTRSGATMYSDGMLYVGGDVIATYAFDPKTYDDAELTGTPPGPGDYSVEVTAINRHGATAANEFLVVVQGELSVAQAIQNTHAALDEPFSYTLDLAAIFHNPNPQSTTVSYALRKSNGDPAPAWVNFNSVTGEISGTPHDGDEAMLELEVTADNGISQASTTFWLGVGSTPVVQHSIPDRLAETGVPDSFVVPEDTIIHPENATLTRSAKLIDGPLPGYMQFTPPGEFAATFSTSGSVVVVYQAEDATYAKASTTFTWASTYWPRFTPGSTMLAGVGRAFSDDVSTLFTDPDGESVSITSSNLPAGFLLTSSGGFSGTPSAALHGAHNITLVGTDPNGAKGYGWADLRVTYYPVCPGLPNRAIHVNQTYSETLSTCPDADTPSDNVLYSITIGGEASWVTVDGRTVSAIPSPDDAGTTAIITRKAHDGEGGTDETSYAIAVENRPPEFVALPEDVVVTTDKPFNVSSEAIVMDPDGHAVAVDVEPRPSWLNWDGSWLWGTAPDSKTEFLLNYTVSDSFGGMTWEEALFTVQSPASFLPFDSRELHAKIGDPYALLIARAEDPEGAMLVYSVQGLPSWATFNDTHVLGIPQEGDQGTKNIEVTVNDGYADTTAIVPVETDHNPVFPQPDDRMALVGETTTFFISPATDADGDPLTYTMAVQPPADSVTFNPMSLTFVIQRPESTDAGGYQITVMVDDGKEGRRSVTFPLDIDNAPKVIGTLAPLAANKDHWLNITRGFPVEDVDDDPLTVTQNGAPWPDWISVESDGKNLMFWGTPTGVSPQTYSGLELVFSDGRGADVKVPVSLSMHVFPRLVVSPPNFGTTVGTLTTIDLSGVFAPGDGGALTTRVGTDAVGWSYNSIFGELTGTPLVQGAQTFNVIALDSMSGSVEAGFQGFIGGAITQPPRVRTGRALTYSVDVSQLFEHIPVAIIGYDAENLPDWMTANANSEGVTLEGIPPDGTTDVSVDIIARDANGARYKRELVFPFQPNSPPTEPPPIPEQTATVAERFSFFVPMEDVDGDNVTVASISRADGKPNRWLRICDARTGEICGTPTRDDVTSFQPDSLVLSAQLSDGTDTTRVGIPITIEGSTVWELLLQFTAGISALALAYKNRHRAYNRFPSRYRLDPLTVDPFSITLESPLEIDLQLPRKKRAKQIKLVEPKGKSGCWHRWFREGGSFFFCSPYDKVQEGLPAWMHLKSNGRKILVTSIPEEWRGRTFALQIRTDSGRRIHCEVLIKVTGVRARSETAAIIKRRSAAALLAVGGLPSAAQFFAGSHSPGMPPAGDPLRPTAATPSAAGGGDPQVAAMTGGTQEVYESSVLMAGGVGEAVEELLETAAVGGGVGQLGGGGSDVRLLGGGSPASVRLTDVGRPTEAGTMHLSETSFGTPDGTPGRGDDDVYTVDPSGFISDGPQML